MIGRQRDSDRRLPIHVNIRGRDHDRKGRRVGENRSRRDPMKVAQYEVLGSLFQAVPVPKGR
jgi:hypothetical protein